jgi:glycosyltransferase involved in cell wall biosynthesis
MNRILFVINDLEFLMSHRKEIVLACVERGMEVHIASDRVGDVPGVRYHKLEMEKTRIDIKGDLRYMGSLAGLMRRLRPDIVHAVTVKPVLYAGLVARVLGVSRIIVSISGLGQLFSTRKGIVPTIVKAMYSLLIYRSHVHFIFQNRGDHRNLSKVAAIRHHSFTVGSGVDLDLFKAPDRTLRTAPIRVLFASRLLISKGIFLFHDAARLFKSRYGTLEVEFIVAGSFDPANPDSITNEQYRLLQESEWITFRGHVRDMPSLLKCCDVFVLPTRYGEGIPKAVLEAMTAGLAVVVSDMEGCLEVVENGVNGLVLAETTPECISDAIADLALDPERRARISERNVAKSDAEFSVDHVVRHHMSLYFDPISSDFR